MEKTRLQPSEVAAVAADWLNNTPGPGRSLWIYVDSQPVGIEYTHRIKRAFDGAFSGYEIPYDTIPSRVVNVVTGNEVYVICQPNHIDTVLNSMHEFSLGDVQVRTTDRPEVLARFGEILDGTDFRIISVNAEKPGEGVYIRKPSYIIVDAVEPYWETLGTFAGRHTQMLETTRVPDEKSLDRFIEAEKRRLGL